MNVEPSAPGIPAPGATSLRRQVLALVVFLAVSFAVSFVGSLPIRANAAGWYAAAAKAPWTPSALAFSSIWLLLYAAMAVAAWLVWRQRLFPRRSALFVYGGLLLLNLAWPLMFFGMFPMLGTAALWLALLLIAAHAALATATVLRFGPISTAAGVLMSPYLSWLLFSASLNLYAALNN
ncbi:MAG TPA: TspO/MBR family protein [Arthrobacter sp.]|nr:TspO/MBR family protein [Arthrobacter sp.]